MRASVGVEVRPGGDALIVEVPEVVHVEAMLSRRQSTDRSVHLNHRISCPVSEDEGTYLDLTADVAEVDDSDVLQRGSIDAFN